MQQLPFQLIPLSAIKIQLIPLSAITRSRVWDFFSGGASFIFFSAFRKRSGHFARSKVSRPAAEAGNENATYRTLTDVAEYLQTLKDKLSLEVSENFREMSTSKKDYDHLFKVTLNQYYRRRDRNFPCVIISPIFGLNSIAGHHW